MDYNESPLRKISTSSAEKVRIIGIDYGRCVGSWWSLNASDFLLSVDPSSSLIDRFDKTLISDPSGPSDEPIPPAYTTNVTLFNQLYSPYAHSYLCWGKSEASKRHRARLLNKEIRRNRTMFMDFMRIFVRDPCLPRGTNDTVSIGHVFRSPCTWNEKERYKPPTNISGVTFVGTGNASLCRQRLMNLFDKKRNDPSARCPYKDEYCTFDHAFQPKLSPNTHFIGLSGYYYVFNNLAFGKKQHPSKKQCTDR